MAEFCPECFLKLHPEYTKHSLVVMRGLDWCEECGKEVFLERRYFTKPLCKKCKVKDTVKEKYGVENVFNLSSSREHLKESLKSEKTKK